MQSKFIKRYVTWIFEPDHAYLSCIIDETKEQADDRFGDPHWIGCKIIHVPIEIQVPKELEHLVEK